MSDTTTKTDVPSAELAETIPSSPTSTSPSNPEPERRRYSTPQKKPVSVGSEVLKYVVSALILSCGFAVAYGLYVLKEKPEEQAATELTQMVGTVEAINYSGQLDKTISGTVVPYREIRVAAEVSGNVIKKYEDCEAGNFVTKGTKLLEIDPTDYELQLKTGLAEVDQSQKMLDETVQEIAGAKRTVKNAQSEYQLAQNEYQRNLRIKSALSGSEFDQSKRTLLSSQSALTTRENTLDMLNSKRERMKSSLALSKSQLERTKLNLGKTVIIAPDDGVIVRETVQEGDFVRTGDQLLTFEDTSRSEVVCNLTPSDLAWVRNNSPASKEFESEQTNGAYSAYYLPKTRVSVFESKDTNVIWDGMLERFDGIGRDQSTLTIPCRITIRKPVIDTEFGQRALVRGMFVKCRIQVQTSTDGKHRKFLSFPAIALRPGNFVWTVVDRKLYRKDVQVVDYGEQLIGEKMTKIVVVSVQKDSVQPGDTIVTTPIPQPVEGIEVLLEGDPIPKNETDEEDKKAANAS